MAKKANKPVQEIRFYLIDECGKRQAHYASDFDQSDAAEAFEKLIGLLTDRCDDCDRITHHEHLHNGKCKDCQPSPKWSKVQS